MSRSLHLTPAVAPPPGVEVFAKTARRLEYKYLVTKGLADDIRAVIRPYVRLDAFSDMCPDKQYTVRSIYYDTRRFGCYEEKVEGFRFKKKFRIRGYNLPEADSVVFLEIKRKDEYFIDKSRAPVRWDQIESVFAGYGPSGGKIPFKEGSREAEAARRFLCGYYHKRMLPVVLVTYEREAFYSRFDRTLRITFDKNVRSRLYPTLDSLYADRDMKYVMPGHFVFEVKFHRGLPGWVRSVVMRFDLPRLAVSKYAMGIDCHRVEKKLLRGVAHTVEFPEAPGPLERRRFDTWVSGVLLGAETGESGP